MTVERWLPVVGYEYKYEVSDRGRVRDMAGRLMAQGPNKAQNGRVKRLQVGLSKAGVKRTHGVHVVVLTAFVGPRPDGAVCRHIDGDATNNRLDNICWGTALENSADRIRHGRQPIGEQVKLSKLTRAEADAIRAEGGSPTVLARKYGVSRSTVRQLLNGKSWR